MRLAYLCNVYPAVSHSFIRREIEGVEAAGHEVHRFSLRPSQSGLRDQADLREAGVTVSILQQGILRLCIAALSLLLSRPVKSFAALARALRLSSPGLERKARHIGYWLEAAWLVRRMERLGVEHLHAHFGTNPAAVAVIARAWGGPPFSFTVHGPDEFDAPLALGLPAKIKAAAFVVAISSYCRSQLMRWSSPAEWEKIELIRCGLGDDFLRTDEKAPYPDSTEFVCIARLSAQKGLPLLIAACDELRASGEAFSLTIIGDGDLRCSLVEDIRHRQLEQIITLAGVRTSGEIRDHLLRARAFVLPSFAEGLPVVIMEACALRRAVITTGVAGIPELIDGKCGWLIPAGSISALVDAMKAALHASPNQLARKAAAGRKRVLRLHDVRFTAARLVRAIQERSM